MNFRILSIITTLFATLGSQAQGVNNMLMSSKSISLGGANSVYIKDASSAYFNPAITSLTEGDLSITGGGGLLSSKTSFINPLYRSTQENSTQPLLIPFHVYGIYKLDENMAVSLAINTPFGVGKRWDNEWTGKYISQDFRVKTQQFQPTFSYKIREDLAVGVGVIVARSSMMYKNRLDFQNINSTYTANALGFGGNIGVWGEISSGTEYGVVFRTPIGYNYKKGSTQLENIPSLMQSEVNASEAITSKYKTPYQLSLSMCNRVAEKIYVTYQFDLDGWRVFKNQSFDFSNENIPDINFERNYKNAFAYRVGGEYRMSEQIHFRGGFYYKESPVADEYLTPEFPDASTLGYTLGGSYIVDENLSIDLGISYENQARRTFQNEQLQFSGNMKTLNYGLVLGANYTL